MHLRLKLLIVVSNSSQDVLASQVLGRSTGLKIPAGGGRFAGCLHRKPSRTPSQAICQNVAVIVHVFLRDDVKFKPFILVVGVCYITFVLSHLL